MGEPVARSGARCCVSTLSARGGEGGVEVVVSANNAVASTSNVAVVVHRLVAVGWVGGFIVLLVPRFRVLRSSIRSQIRVRCQNGRQIGTTLMRGCGTLA